MQDPAAARCCHCCYRRLYDYTRGHAYPNEHGWGRVWGMPQTIVDEQHPASQAYADMPDHLRAVPRDSVEVDSSPITHNYSGCP
eukprot:COSAG05_NODE_87_length_20404_cov_42.272051_21_plen_84_part_00